MGRVSRKIGWLAVITGLALAVPGCTFRELNKNQKEIDRAGRLYISIEGEPFEDHPVYVALVREPEDDMAAVTVETYKNLPEIGPAELRAPSGQYFVVAFQDVNANKRYDHSEPFAVYGEPAAIDLWPGRVIRDLTLSMDVPVLSGHWSPQQLQDRGIKLSDRVTDFGTKITLDDPRFDREVARTGMWKPAEFIHGNNPGLYMLEDYDPAKIPVVFVHGIGGSPRHFATIIEQMDRERFQPWLIYYPSALPLQDLGDYLQTCLHRMRPDFGHHDYVVVSHSMGGLVAWAGLRTHLEQTATPYIDLVVTIHSPLGGMASAAAGVDHAPIVMECWHDLDPRSDFLKAIYNDPLPDDIPYHLFYGIAPEQAPDTDPPTNKGELDEALRGLDADELSDETVSLNSQLHRPAVARAAAIHGGLTTHMGCLRDAETIAKLNGILAANADRSAK